MSLRALQGPTGGGAPVGGSGTSSPSTIPRWTGASTLGDSGLIDDGSAVYTTTRFIGIGRSTAIGTNCRLNVQLAGSTASGYTAPSNAAALFDCGVAANGGIGLVGGGALGYYFGNASDGYDGGVEYISRILYLRGKGTRALAVDGGNVGIGTASPGYRLDVATDASFYGVVVGRGAGGVSTNTAVGSNALASNTTGSTNTAVGAYAGYRHTVNTAVAYVGYAAGRYQTGGLNTAFGYQALLGVDGSSSGALNTAIGSESLAALTSGANNTALGRQSGLVLTSGGSNVLLGLGAGNTITTGSQNICIGVNATTAAAADSNQLVIGASGNYVATNGGATTYYATAGASLGYIQVRLNGANVKIQVFAP